MFVSETRKNLTWGRTDHFRNIFFRDLEIWPFTLTSKLDLDLIKMNHPAEYLHCVSKNVTALACYDIELHERILMLMECCDLVMCTSDMLGCYTIWCLNSCVQAWRTNATVQLTIAWYSLQVFFRFLFLTVEHTLRYLLYKYFSCLSSFVYMISWALSHNRQASQRDSGRTRQCTALTTRDHNWCPPAGRPADVPFRPTEYATRLDWQWTLLACLLARQIRRCRRRLRRTTDNLLKAPPSGDDDLSRFATNYRPLSAPYTTQQITLALTLALTITLVILTVPKILSPLGKLGLYVLLALISLH